MTALKTFFTNAAESTLSSSLASGATTINVTDTSAFPSVPFYVVIDPDVNASREVILVDGSKTATTFTLSAASKRGQDGTTDTAHSSGAKVAFVPVAAHMTDLHDRMDTAYVTGGTDVAVADGGTGASTAAGARTNLGLAIGTDVQAHSTVLDNTTASFTTADETKLDGIEALADVTDATNVAAAGAVMESDTTTAAMSFVVDEDNMVSNSATKVPTQQSVKAYVDAATSGGGTTTVVKAADETVTSSTTLQDDNELVIALAANTDYAFEFVAFPTGSSTSDFKYGFTVPTGASIIWRPEGTTSTAVTTSGGTAVIGTNSTTDPVGGVTQGSVRVGSTAGNLTLQWAQNNGGGDTVLKAGSYLKVTAVA